MNTKLRIMFDKWRKSNEITGDYYKITSLHSDIEKLIKRGVHLYDSRTIDLIHRVNIIINNIELYDYLTEEDIKNIPYKKVNNLSECRDLVRYLLRVISQAR